VLTIIHHEEYTKFHGEVFISQNINIMLKILARPTSSNYFKLCTGCDKCAQRADYSSPSPNDTEFKIDFNLVRKKDYLDEERDTESKCTKLVYEYIKHYFKEFEDSLSDQSIFFFVDPDQLFEDRYEQDPPVMDFHGITSSAEPSSGDTELIPEPSETDGSGSDELQNSTNEVQESILLYIDRSVSVENDILAKDLNFCPSCFRCLNFFMTLSFPLPWKRFPTAIDNP